MVAKISNSAAPFLSRRHILTPRQLRAWLSAMLEGMSRRALGGLSASGSYNVRASELARDRGSKSLRITVAFLDDTHHIFELQKRSKGQALLDVVFHHLEIIEKDYFGLQYSDTGTIPNSNNSEHMRWVEPMKPLKKQLRSKLGQPFVVFFRIKFYVSDPSKLQEEYTRYHFFLQIKKDVLEGRLVVNPATACLLASYAVQSEFGDYNAEEHSPDYLSELRLMPGQSEEMEKRISELHKLHNGQTPADSEFNYLNHAKQLDMYGVDLHSAKDSSGKELQLGVTSIGLVVFHNNIKINTFSWSKIIKLSFKRREFYIHLRRELSENYDTLLGFHVASYRSCKTLWKACVEHHSFFRLQMPCPTRRHFIFPLRLGSRFRYSGRTEFQTLEEGRRKARLHRTFLRSPSKRLRESVPATTVLSEESVEKKKQQISAVPAVTSSVTTTPRVANGNGPHAPSHRPYEGLHKVQSLGSKEPRKAWAEGTSPDQEIREVEDRPFAPAIPVKVLAFVDEPEDGVEELDMRPPLSPPTLSRPSLPSLGLMLPLLPPITPPPPLHLAISRPDTLEDYEFASIFGIKPTVVEPISSSELPVRIRLRPDDQGRFGFNVKGGADLKMPVIVSRVAPSTPADRCYPRLNEGDQVLYINGRDVSGMTHEQVVNFIRATRETASGELLLTVRQNVYVGEESEEPAFQYVPEAPEVAALVVEGDALTESMLLLSEGLDSGALLAQFDRIYRRKPGLPMNEARRGDNNNRNRYRDIAPYDSTRVILQSGTNDYINANYVNMEIPGSGIINRYIATQGPLPQTVSDFWQMVWEADSTLVVMLTTVIERGRVKCEEYWPAPPEHTTARYGGLQITTTKQEEEDGFVFREFRLLHEESGEERDITHMQYLAWPDHGVPEEFSSFVSFVQKVRAARTGQVAPAVVHCSAGIGRTGVLVLMETVMGLIEAHQPIYPLDIVRSMRDQRAMMVQTPSQFRFVCECVVKVFKDGIVKPLREFQR